MKPRQRSSSSSAHIRPQHLCPTYYLGVLSPSTLDLRLGSTAFTRILHQDPLWYLLTTGLLPEEASAIAVTIVSTCFGIPRRGTGRRFFSVPLLACRLTDSFLQEDTLNSFKPWRLPTKWVPVDFTCNTSTVSLIEINWHPAAIQLHFIQFFLPSLLLLPVLLRARIKSFHLGIMRHPSISIQRSLPLGVRVCVSVCVPRLGSCFHFCCSPQMAG